MSRIIGSVGVAAVLALAVGAAQAAVVVVDTTVELAGESPWHSIVYLPQSVLVSQGDTVDMTVRFAPGQALQIHSNGGYENLTGWLLQDYVKTTIGTSAFTIDSISYSLLGLTGKVSAPFILDSQTDGVAHIGPAFRGYDFIAAGDTISFTGYHTSFHVAALQGDNGSSYYFGPWVEFIADEIAVIAVPEPSAWALLVAGLASAGVLVRHNRKSSLRRPAAGAERTRCPAAPSANSCASPTSAKAMARPSAA
jgi:PEP-CTERM motif